MVSLQSFPGGRRRVPAHAPARAHPLGLLALVMLAATLCCARDDNRMSAHKSSPEDSDFSLGDEYSNEYSNEDNSTGSWKSSDDLSSAELGARKKSDRHSDDRDDSEHLLSDGWFYIPFEKSKVLVHHYDPMESSSNPTPGHGNPEWSGDDGPSSEALGRKGTDTNKFRGWHGYLRDDRNAPKKRYGNTDRYDDKEKDRYREDRDGERTPEREGKGHRTIEEDVLKKKKREMLKRKAVGDREGTRKDEKRKRGYEAEDSQYSKTDEYDEYGKYDKNKPDYGKNKPDKHSERELVVDRTGNIYEKNKHQWMIIDHLGGDDGGKNTGRTTKRKKGNSGMCPKFFAGVPLWSSGEAYEGSGYHALHNEGDYTKQRLCFVRTMAGQPCKEGGAVANPRSWGLKVTNVVASEDGVTFRVHGIKRDNARDGAHLGRLVNLYNKFYQNDADFIRITAQTVPWGTPSMEALLSFYWNQHGRYHLHISVNPAGGNLWPMPDYKNAQHIYGNTNGWSHGADQVDGVKLDPAGHVDVDFRIESITDRLGDDESLPQDVGFFIELHDQHHHNWNHVAAMLQPEAVFSARVNEPSSSV